MYVFVARVQVGFYTYYDVGEFYRTQFLENVCM